MRKVPKTIWIDEDRSAWTKEEDAKEGEPAKYIRADPPLDIDQILEGFKATGLMDGCSVHTARMRLHSFTEGVRFAERMRNDE